MCPSQTSQSVESSWDYWDQVVLQHCSHLLCPCLSHSLATILVHCCIHVAMSVGQGSPANMPLRLRCEGSWDAFVSRGVGGPHPIVQTEFFCAAWTHLQVRLVMAPNSPIAILSEMLLGGGHFCSDPPTTIHCLVPQAGHVGRVSRCPGSACRLGQHHALFGVATAK